MDDLDVLALVPPSIEFFDQNNAGGEPRCVFPTILLNAQPVWVYSASALGCGNDTIRSAVFRNVPQGVRVVLCDDGSDCSDDDLVEITVLQTDRYEVVDTLESSYNNGVVDVDYSGGNGLDGKVSTLLFFRN